MTRRPLLALPLALALWPAAAAAQDGPSFNCSYASTRTEAAICASPALARLESTMFNAYLGLVDRVGEREARRVADELLQRRQACEGDADCITERLLISMEVFHQRGRPTGTVAEALAPVPEAPAPVAEAPAPVPEPLPIPEPPEQEIALLDAPDPDLPLAAQAPLPPDMVPIPPSRELVSQELTAEELGQDLDEALDSAELASSDGTADPAEATFDTPLSWAFMDLDREERAAIQRRLSAADFHQGDSDGTWTVATQTSLEGFAVTEGSGSFDLSTQTGAALLLDYIASDAFAAAFGVEEAALDSAPEASVVASVPPSAIDQDDPLLESTDW